MKILHLSLFLILSITNALAFNITTSRSTLTLPPLEGLDSGGLREAARIDEIALRELTADAAVLGEGKAALIEEKEAFDRTREEEQATLNEMAARHETLKNAYENNLAPYNASARAFDAEAAEERAQALASNSLPPDQRDPATVLRLNNWARELGVKKALLEQQQAILKDEQEMVNTQRAAVLTFKEGADPRIKTDAAALQAKIDTWNVKHGLAYRQLQQCIACAEKVVTITQAENYNWGAEIYFPSLDGAMEHIKALSSNEFDTP